MVVAALAFVLFRSNTFVADLSKNDFSTTVFVVFSNLTMFFQDWFLFLEIDNGALRQRDGPSPVLPGLSCRFRLRVAAPSSAAEAQERMPLYPGKQPCPLAGVRRPRDAGSLPRGCSLGKAVKLEWP
jgi:hypothetical protein